MFPLSVISWKLGNLDSESYETLIQEVDIEDLVDEIQSITSGFYYLATCQRIIIVVDQLQRWVLDEIITKYLNHINIPRNARVEPQIIQGTDALTYLCLMVSGLDSLVLGEYEIQHQFKQGYGASTPYLSSFMKTYLQYVIRVGKRIRHEFQLDRTSTIEEVVFQYPQRFERHERIALIGTGKMGEAILRFFDQRGDHVQVFSTHNDRVGDHLAGHDIHRLDDLTDFGIIVTATSQVQFIDADFVNGFQLQDNLLIIDLGMPRNVDPQLSSDPGIDLVNIETLVHNADDREHLTQLTRAKELISEEVQKIIQEYKKQLRSEVIVSLREEMNEYAKDNAPCLVDESDSKEFTQFINSLIHISQKHVEKVLSEDRMA